MAMKETIDLEVIKGMHPDCFDTPEDIANLGCDYCNGEGVNENCEIGRALLEKAAEMGCVYAMTALGYLYHDDDYDGHDDEIAFEWFVKAATNGELEASFMLGVFCDNGYYVEKDETMAFYQYKIVAYHGSDAAQFNVGFDYEYGIGVSQNYKLAVKWYQLACKQGNVEAMNNLGMMYSIGLGVEKDENKAFQLVTSSALGDDPVGMKNLGYFYKNGTGCQRNTTIAMEWFLKAKENGEDIDSPIINMIQLLRQSNSKDPLSEYQIAEYYRKGEGLSRSIKLGSRRNNRINRFRNYKKAVKWFIKAAIHDQSENAVIAQAAYYKLGTIFQDLAEDLYEVRYEEKAIKYYTMAANCGLPIAFCKLGEMYESNGEVKKAIEYYNRASDEAYFKYGIKTILHS